LPVGTSTAGSRASRGEPGPGAVEIRVPPRVPALAEHERRRARRLDLGDQIASSPASPGGRRAASCPRDRRRGAVAGIDQVCCRAAAWTSPTRALPCARRCSRRSDPGEDAGDPDRRHEARRRHPADDVRPGLEHDLPDASSRPCRARTRGTARRRSTRPSDVAHGPQEVVVRARLQATAAHLQHRGTLA